MSKLRKSELAVLKSLVEGSKTHYQLWMKERVCMSAGPVSRALQDLEGKGLVVSVKETGGRRRRFYTITKKGLEVLKKQL